MINCALEDNISNYLFTACRKLPRIGASIFNEVFNYSISSMIVYIIISFLFRLFLIFERLLLQQNQHPRRDIKPVLKILMIPFLFCSLTFKDMLIWPCTDSLMYQKNLEGRRVELTKGFVINENIFLATSHIKTKTRKAWIVCREFNFTQKCLMLNSVKCLVKVN